MSNLLWLTHYSITNQSHVLNTDNKTISYTNACQIFYGFSGKSTIHTILSVTIRTSVFSPHKFFTVQAHP